MAIIATRLWQLRNNGMLSSLNATVDLVWEQGPTIAKCMNMPVLGRLSTYSIYPSCQHTANICNLGLRALKDLTLMQKLQEGEFAAMRNSGRAHSGRYIVAGQVLLWGWVKHQDNGVYLAQYAKPHRLFLEPTYDIFKAEAIQAAASYYDIPIETLDPAEPANQLLTRGYTG